MGADSKIEWTDHTFNPWLGCSKVSPGCEHCYAESWAKRSGLVQWGPHPRRRTSATTWHQPLKWQREAARTGERPRVFCASLADVFDDQAPSEWRADLWRLIRDTPALDWLLCTKRIGNALDMLPVDWGDGWAHVWLLVSICTQAEAGRDIPRLLEVPAAIRGLSCEPLLGPLDLTHLDADAAGSPTMCQIDALTGRHTDMGRPCPDVPRLDWVIVGGESGPHARPMRREWARSIRDQCQGARVPFFMKQMTGRKPIPADLMVREFHHAKG
jgi:protein gp37